MSSGGGPSSSTVTQTTVPEYLRPYVEEMAGQARGLAQYEIETGYKPYYGQRFAGFTPMQAQAFQNVADIQTPQQITDASNMAFRTGQLGIGAAQETAPQLMGAAQQFGQQGANIGGQAAALAPDASGYGAQGAGYGQTAAQIGIQGGQQAQQAGLSAQQMAGQYGAQGAGIGQQAAGMAGMGYGAGQQYAQQATSPGAMQAYMSPYMQNVVDVQQREARRAADIQREQNQAIAAKQGAFGGSRQAIVEAELQRNLGTQLGDIQATGLQQAFGQAQQAQQFGAGLGLQGLQAGTQAQLAGIQGAQTGLQGVGQQIAGGQLGLAGTQAGIAGQQAGMQGAQTGIQGLQQAGQLYGLGMQGAQTGLQGVQGAISAGQYGLGGLGAAQGAAGQLGQLGGQQFDQQMGLTDAMQKYGALQQQMQQQALDYDYQQYLAEQNLPYQQLGYFSDMIRGLPLSQSSQQVYGGQPDIASQLGGLAMAGYGMFGRKEGGQIKKYAEGGAVTGEGLNLESVGALPGRLRRLSDSQLAAYARTVKDAITLSAIQSELERRSKMRQPYEQGPEGTTAQMIAQQAEAATVGQPRVSMAGGGIVALQAGGNPLIRRGPMGMTPEVLSRTPSPGEPMPSPNTESLGRANVLQPGAVGRYAADVPSQVETIGSQGMGLPPQGAPTPPPVETIGEQGTVPVPPPPRSNVGLDQLRDRGQQPPQMAPAGRGSNLGATFEEFRKMIPKGEMSPEQTALLDDMRSRLEQKTAKAGDQEDKSKYEAIMLAGLAMMGGTSLADGIARAAQVGGATYMSSKKEARKALNDAENAELAFRQYQLEVMKGNDKEAQGQFDTFLNFTAKMADVDAKSAMADATRGSVVWQRVDNAVANDRRVRAAEKAIELEVNPTKKAALTQEYHTLLNTVRREKERQYGVTSPSGGETPPPVPSSKDQLKSGTVYNTARGPARWNGERFELVQ